MIRSCYVTQTQLNYTGQRKDDTRLLYYHARYYDPGIARFVSPDSIVPEAPSTTVAQAQLPSSWGRQRDAEAKR